MKKLLKLTPFLLLIIWGCSQKSTTVENMEIKCIGVVSVTSQSDPKSNVEMIKNVKINFNFQDSKIFYPFDLLYLSIPREGVKCIKQVENTVCEFNDKKDLSEHTISINLQKSLSMNIVEKINRENNDRMTTYSGLCEKVIY